jgi:CheY-like chemotaxis protein
VGLTALHRSIRTVPDLDTLPSGPDGQDPSILVVSVDTPVMAAHALRQAQARFPAARIIALCAPAHRPDAGSPAFALADAWLDKPTPLPQLIAALAPLDPPDADRSGAEGSRHGGAARL